MSTIAQILDEDNPDSEGSYVGDQLHAFTCPCEACAEENSRIERLWAERGDQRSEDERYESLEAFKAECQERIDAREWAEGMAVWHKWRDAAERERLHLDDPEYPALEAAMEMEGVESSAKLAYLKAHDAAFLYGETDADADAAGRKAKDAVTAKGERAALRAMEAYSELVHGIDPVTLPHTLQIAPGPTSAIPPILFRSDGETLMYAGMLNTIFGEPGSGKSWLALMAVIQGVRDGRRSVWWDFESSTSTLATRLVALGAADLVGCDDILWATPDLAGDKAAIEKSWTLCPRSGTWKMGSVR